MQRFGRIMPWDDDIDMAIDDAFVAKLTKDLPSKSSSAWCKKQSSSCKVWILNHTENIDIVWKNWGMPFKVVRRGERLPNMDINTYSRSNNVVTVPPNQLKNGHIHTFSVKDKWMFPTQFAPLTIGQRTLSAPVPAESEVVLKHMYGNDVLSTCITSHSHGSICRMRGFCENAMANHLPKVTFPCSLLG